jgi:hypothetical protein
MFRNFSITFKIQVFFNDILWLNQFKFDRKLSIYYICGITVH